MAEVDAEAQIELDEHREDSLIQDLFQTSINSLLMDPRLLIPPQKTAQLELKLELNVALNCKGRVRIGIVCSIWPPDQSFRPTLISTTLCTPQLGQCFQSIRMEMSRMLPGHLEPCIWVRFVSFDVNHLNQRAASQGKYFPLSSSKR